LFQRRSGRRRTIRLIWSSVCEPMMSDDNAIPVTNLQVIKPSRKVLQAGDIFVLHPRSRGYFFGRVVRTDAKIRYMTTRPSRASSGGTSSAIATIVLAEQERSPWAGARCSATPACLANRSLRGKRRGNSRSTGFVSVEIGGVHREFCICSAISAWTAPEGRVASAEMSGTDPASSRHRILGPSNNLSL